MNESVQRSAKPNTSSAARRLLISADSHVTETPSVWDGLLDKSFWGNAAPLKRTRGIDPATRASEMSRDGVVAEVLYPTLGLPLFGISDVELHEATCRAYNLWLAKYCDADPDRLLGIGLIPCYQTDIAVAELRACSEAGLRGVMVWQSPHPDLPFTSMHYEPVWAVAEELELPVSVHILTGFNYSRKNHKNNQAEERLRRIDHYRRSVNEKLACAIDTLFAFIFGGVFERFPRLKLVIVENEVSWLPFILNQWDYYYTRFLEVEPVNLSRAPSEYFNDQVFATFFRDPWVGRMLPTWGINNLMWSNDYPHPNSTWPDSQRFIAAQLSKINPDAVDRVLRSNCADIYGIRQDLPLATP